MKPCIAVIGGGYWGKNVLRSFHAIGALHSVCDVSSEVLTRVQNDYPDVATTADYAEILQDESIIGVAIAAPVEHHFALAQQALAAGKHVFVEKPITTSVREAERLIAQAEAAGRVLMVGHLLHYHSAVIALKEMIRDGVFGKLHFVQARRLNFGKLRSFENVLWSFAPHDVSVVLGLIGHEPTGITARGSAFLQSTCHDMAYAQLEFANDIRASIEVSWLNPVKEQRLTVIGEKAMAVFDDQAPWDQKLAVYDHAVAWDDGVTPRAVKAEPRYVDLPQSEPLKDECQHFVDCCLEGKTPITDGHEGRRVLHVLQQIDAQLNLPAQQAAQRDDYFAHESAVVDQGCEIGTGTKIWHFTHVMPKVSIGERCSLGQNVVVMPNVRLGDNVKVQNNVSLYEGVICEDDVFLGPSMVFTNVTNPRSHVSRRDSYETTVVRQGASIGANATVVCGCEIGRYAFIGAGTVVTKDVPAYALMYGNPGRVQGWMCQCGVRLPFSTDEGQEEASCSDCGTKYTRNGAQVQEAEATVRVIA